MPTLLRTQSQMPWRACAQAKTSLVAKIESATRGQVGYGYPEHDGGQPYANEFTGRAASAASHAVYTITHTAADSAQLPYKLEWLVGVNIEINGDSRLIQGTRALTHLQPRQGPTNS